MGWDDVLEGEIEQDLRKILVEMVVTPDIEFPRAVIPVDVEAKFELLGFCDGGKPGSSAIIRHKLEEPYDEQTHSVRLLLSKARVTSISPTATCNPGGASTS